MSTKVTEPFQNVNINAACITIEKCKFKITVKCADVGLRPFNVDYRHRKVYVGACTTPFDWETSHYFF